MSVSLSELFSSAWPESTRGLPLALGRLVRSCCVFPALCSVSLSDAVQLCLELFALVSKLSFATQRVVVGCARVFPTSRSILLHAAASLLLYRAMLSAQLPLRLAVNEG